MHGTASKYQALTPRTKALIGIGVMGYAVAGLFLSDTAEEKFGMKATAEDKAKLREMIPRIHTVDKDASPIAKDQ
jgi:predicted dinucleotide-binding enzyme